MHGDDRRVRLRDGSAFSPFFRAVFSDANCPQNRSNSATLRSGAAELVASGGAKAVSLRSAYSRRRRNTGHSARPRSRQTRTSRCPAIAT